MTLHYLFSLVSGTLPGFATHALQPCQHASPPIFSEIYVPDSAYTLNYRRDEHELLTADFNNDGFADTAWLSQPLNSSSNANPSAVTLALGCEHGYLTEQTILNLTSTAFELVAADFDSDGNIDLAVPKNSVFNTFEIYLGRGDATFAPPITFVSDARPSYRLQVADLDSDGDPDLITDKGILRNDWPEFVGSFEPGSRFEDIFSNVSPIDLDHDGILEILGSGYVYTFNPDLSFASADTFPRFNGQAVAADFDRDGQRELAVTSRSEPDLLDDFPIGLSIWKTTRNAAGDYKLLPTTWADDSDPIDFRNGLLAADVDSDGWIDVIGGVTLLRPLNPKSRFLGWPGSQYFGISQTGDDPDYVLADVNGDGTLDRASFASVRLAGRRLNGLPGGPVESLGVSEIDFVAHLLVEDLDGDGTTDLFAVSDGAGPVIAFGNSSYPRGFLFDDIQLTNTGQQLAFFHVAKDINNDGLTDVIAGTYDGTLWAFQNNGDRTFAATEITAPDAPAGIVAFDLADLDSDSFPEIVAAISDPDAPNAEFLVLNNNNGSFTPSQRLMLPNDSGCIRLVLNDHDSDGDLDAIITDRLSDSNPGLLIAEQDQGRFLPAARVELGRSTYWIEETNIDNDPEYEILIGAESSDLYPDHNILAIDRDETGRLRWDEPKVIAEAFSRIYEFTLTDFTGDGNPDLLVGSSSAQLCIADTTDPLNFLNNEIGIPSISGGIIGAFATLDLNGDGRQDFLSNSRFLGATFQGQTTYPFCRTDYNADNIVDLSDIQSFIDYFLAQHPAADINRDTVVDLSDIQEFVDRFVAGC